MPDSMPEKRPHFLLYDGDCGFCRWSVVTLLRWDRRKALRPLPLQDPRAERLLPRMDPHQKMASWHLATPEGRVYSGGKAFPPLLRLMPGGRPIAWLAALFPGVIDRAYESISRNRQRLGRYLHSDRRPVVSSSELPLEESLLGFKEGPGQNHNESRPIPRVRRLE